MLQAGCSAKNKKGGMVTDNVSELMKKPLAAVYNSLKTKCRNPDADLIRLDLAMPNLMKMISGCTKSSYLDPPLTLIGTQITGK